MHTVRNRMANRPPARSKGKRPNPRPPAVPPPPFLLRASDPPSFPPGLIVPAPRGAIIAALPWPEAVASPALPEPPAPSPPKRAKPRRKPVAKPGRKRARSSSPKRAAAPPRRRARAAKVAAAQPPSVPQPAIDAATTDALLDRALSMKAEPMPQPNSSEPTAPPPAALSSAEVCPDQPLSRSRSLALPPPRSLGEAIGRWLRDAGRWIARLSARRRQSPAERAMLARASARHMAIQSQLAADATRVPPVIRPSV